MMRPGEGRGWGCSPEQSGKAEGGTGSEPRRDTLTYDTLGEPLRLGTYNEFWEDDDDNVVYEEGPAYEAFILDSSTSERCQIE